jgi:5,10-methylenetetrahydrofolate reductase
MKVLIIIFIKKAFYMMREKSKRTLEAENGGKPYSSMKLMGSGQYGFIYEKTGMASESGRTSSAVKKLDEQNKVKEAMDQLAARVAPKLRLHIPISKN